MLSDDRTSYGADRLPWLADDEVTAPVRYRGQPLLWILAVLMVGCTSYWFGSRAVSSSETVREYAQVQSPLTPLLAGQAPYETPRPQQASVSVGSGVAQLKPSADPSPREELPTAAAYAPPVKTSARESNLTSLQAPDHSTQVAVNLSELDQSLAALHHQAWSRAGTEKRAKLLVTQERFIKRLSNCRSIECRRNAYLNRMGEISAVMGGRWQPPNNDALASSSEGTLNLHLASLYNQSWSKADGPKRAVLLAGQDAFLGRLGVCQSGSCRTRVYLDRIRQVAEVMAIRQTASGTSTSAER